MARSTTIKVQAVDLLDALPMCGVDGCPNAGDVPAVLEAAGALGWRIRMRLCSPHMLEGLALRSPCAWCGDPIEPGKPHPQIKHLSRAQHRQMLMEDAARRDEPPAEPLRFRMLCASCNHAYYMGGEFENHRCKP